MKLKHITISVIVLALYVFLLLLFYVVNSCLHKTTDDTNALTGLPSVGMTENRTPSDSPSDNLSEKNILDKLPEHLRALLEYKGNDDESSEIGRMYPTMYYLCTIFSSDEYIVLNDDFIQASNVSSDVVYDKRVMESPEEASGSYNGITYKYEWNNPKDPASWTTGTINKSRIEICRSDTRPYNAAPDWNHVLTIDTRKTSSRINFREATVDFFNPADSTNVIYTLKIGDCLEGKSEYQTVSFGINLDIDVFYCVVSGKTMNEGNSVRLIRCDVINKNLTVYDVKYELMETKRIFFPDYYVVAAESSDGILLYSPVTSVITAEKEDILMSKKIR